MVIMGAKGETMVEVRLFDSARFYKTSSSAWSQEDQEALQPAAVDDREWADWDDEEWASSDDDDEDAAHAGAAPGGTTRGALTPGRSPAVEEPQGPESRRKLMVGATPGRTTRPGQRLEGHAQAPPAVIPSVAHGGEESGWGSSYTDLAASPARGTPDGARSTPPAVGDGEPQPLLSPREQQASDRRASPPDGRPQPAQPQPRIRSRGRYLGSAGGMGMQPVRSQGSDKGVEKADTPAAVRLSPSPSSAPALDTGSLADMMAEAMAMVSPRTDPANGPSRGADTPGEMAADEFLLPSIHGQKVSQVSPPHRQPGRSRSQNAAGPTLARGRPGAGRRRGRHGAPRARRSAARETEHVNAPEVYPDNLEHAGGGGDGGGGGHCQHGGWKHAGDPNPDDDGRLPSLNLYVTNNRGANHAAAAVARAGVHRKDEEQGRMDAAIAHIVGGEEENYPPMGHTNHLLQQQQHAQGYVGGGPGGFTMMRRQPRHGRRQRSREQQDKQSLAVVSRRHGAGGETEQAGPPPIFLTSQLQQNVMNKIETEGGGSIRTKPGAGRRGHDGNDAKNSNPHTAAVSRSDARKQRQQRLARGLPP